MGRVKFNVNTEYAYLQNFKILQSTPYVRDNSITSMLIHVLDAFTRHSIERQVPVESLIKCKMQDNLEFLQWSKRYWDQYFPGGDYDALARRKGAGGGPPAAAPVSSRTSGAGAGSGAARRGTTPTTTPAARSTRPAVGGGASAAVQQENTQLKSTVEGLERERDFYFSKLRDIELLLQQAVEADPEIEKDDEGLVKHIQAILYSTEVSGSSSDGTCYRMTDYLYRKDLRYPQRQKGARWTTRKLSRQRDDIDVHEKQVTAF